MRPQVGVVGAVTLAVALVACASISGLSSYSTEDCSFDACGAGVHPMSVDGTVEAGVVPGTDASNDDADAGTGDDGEAGVTCSGGLVACNGVCVDTATDPANCGGCRSGTTHTCPGGETCANGVCTGVPCPDGGCPSSAATGFSPCPFGGCNSASGQCTEPGGCVCSNDTHCLSGKCIKVKGDNDVSCGSNCTGSGLRDGFDCELASPGIPQVSGAAYSCPANSGFRNTTLTCDPTGTNCYCTADAQCPSGKCVPSANNRNCTGCSGTGTQDYRGCQPMAAIPTCLIYIGCPANTVCQYPNCHCTSDAACASGHCIGCAGCTGTGADDGHGCEPPPTSVPCMGSGGTMCTTALTPAPVLNAGHTACLCVSDADCSSGKCVNANSQCTGTCTGSAPKDSEDCETATSVANAWSCSIGNCSNVSSQSGMCTAAGVPCWCKSDAQCPSGTQCASWSGCASGACTGTASDAGAGTVNAFHCVSGG